jgi:transcriptional regulator with XRE-family HTH domain
MSTFGERLRQERESRNITLQEMSESTKIALHCFKLLENDDFANLPGGLYNKGYVRAYAQFIGLDPEPLLKAYALAQQTQEPEASEHNSEVSHALSPSATSGWDGATGTRLRSWQRTWLLVPFAVILVGIVGWSYFRGGPLEATISTKISAPTFELEPSEGRGKARQPEANPTVLELSALPQRTQGETMTAVEDDGRLSIAEFGVGTRIVHHQLENQAEHFEEGTQVWFWTRVLGGEAGEPIRHIWLYENREVDSVELILGGPHWRTQSRRTLHSGSAGRWAAEARDSAGLVMARQEFTSVKSDSVSGATEDSH